ncbi:DUF3441-containing protein [Aureococcus anophagefferens]|nr:DUF3441-containing protein [Aureococcus anophagefferens]
MPKARFTLSDVAAMSREVLERCGDWRVAQVYDGDGRSFVFKLQQSGEAGKRLLLLESGTKFLVTKYDAREGGGDMPSGLCTKLRSALKGKRLSDVRSLGRDRVVLFRFGAGVTSFHVVLELYAAGNVVLCDHDFVVRARTRSATGAELEVGAPVARRRAFDSFCAAVDEYGRETAEAKLGKASADATAAISRRVDKIRLDQAERLARLTDDQGGARDAAALERSADAVDKVLAVLRNALASGLRWEEIDDYVRTSRRRVAARALVHDVDYERKRVTVALPATTTRRTATTTTTTRRRSSSSTSRRPRGSARELWAAAKKARAKAEKTATASAAVVAAAEKQSEAKLKARLWQQEHSGKLRKQRDATPWFCRYAYFASSEGYLCVCGRDKHQTETLLFGDLAILRPGDAVVCCDAAGAPPRRPRPPDRRGLSPLALHEAGCFVACRSSAWAKRDRAPAWWVWGTDVKKCGAPRDPVVGARRRGHAVRDEDVPAADAARAELRAALQARRRRVPRPPRRRAGAARARGGPRGAADAADGEAEPEPEAEPEEPEEKPEPEPEEPEEEPEPEPEEPEEEPEEAAPEEEDEPEPEEVSTSKKLSAEKKLVKKFGGDVVAMRRAEQARKAKEARSAARRSRARRAEPEPAPAEPEPAAPPAAPSAAALVDGTAADAVARLGPLAKTAWATCVAAVDGLAPETMAFELGRLARLDDAVAAEALALFLEADGEEASRRAAALDAAQRWRSGGARPGAAAPTEDKAVPADDGAARAFTGAPKDGDALAWALPVCAPTAAARHYAHALKLQPGTQKKGKAAKDALEILARSCDDADRRDLVKAVDVNECILAFVSSTKITHVVANQLKQARKHDDKMARKLKRGARASCYRDGTRRHPRRPWPAQARGASLTALRAPPRSTTTSKASLTCVSVQRLTSPSANTPPKATTRSPSRSPAAAAGEPGRTSATRAKGAASAGGGVPASARASAIATSAAGGASAGASASGSSASIRFMSALWSVEPAGPSASDDDSDGAPSRSRRLEAPGGGSDAGAGAGDADDASSSDDDFGIEAFASAETHASDGAAAAAPAKKKKKKKNFPFGSRKRRRPAVVAAAKQAAAKKDKAPKITPEPVVEKRQAWYAIKFPDGSETAVRKMYLTETAPEAEA